MRDKLEKRKAITARPADAEADIALINQYSIKELTPEDVYCFAVKLCDNEVDRDYERFDRAALEKLAGLFLGKTGIFDHAWRAENQVARLYKTEVVQGEGKTQAGDKYCYLRGYAYMVRSEANAGLIKEVEAGIKKEVSVGCAVSHTVCSICGSEAGNCGHSKGQTYNGKLCFFTLSNPTDAFEWSFVAVPAQRSAGVTKSAEEKNKDLDWAIDVLMDADLTDHVKKVVALYHKCGKALVGAREWAERMQIMADNETFRKRYLG